MKDNWDRKLIIINILGTIIIGVITIATNAKLKSIDQGLQWQQHDLAVLQEFRKTYADENMRGISLRYLNLIKDKETKIQIRLIVSWDLLRQIVKTKSNLGRKYKFDKNLNNAYYLAENLRRLSHVDAKQTINLFNRLINKGPNIYKDYSSKEQFYLLLSWLAESVPSIKKSLPLESKKIIGLVDSN